MNHGLNG